MWGCGKEIHSARDTRTLNCWAPGKQFESSPESCAPVPLGAANSTFPKALGSRSVWIPLGQQNRLWDQLAVKELTEAAGCSRKKKKKKKKPPCRCLACLQGQALGAKNWKFRPVARSASVEALEEVAAVWLASFPVAPL